MEYSPTLIKKKLDGIKFRGPDNYGFESTNGITFAHLRLSIIDLDKRSNQPMWYKHLVITYNGEIYNYKELRNQLESAGFEFGTESDTEVLLIGFSHWGVDLLEKINGMFAFCIYNELNKQLFCARDRLGVKPFYYYWKDGSFEICSQLRPLINKDSKVNEEAIGIYLDCGYIPSPFSALEDVNKLSPGHFMIIDLPNENLTITPYWDLKRVEYVKKLYKETKKELHDLIKDAVRIRLQSDVPLGSFLSGGIDSALITAVASELSDSPINSFSVGFEDPNFDESKVAEQYANILGTRHQTIQCKIEDILGLIPKHAHIYDEPFSDSSALPSLLLNKVTKEYVTVALSGDGGDESFLGYNYFRFLKKNRILYSIPIWIRVLIVRIGLLPLFRKFLKKAIPNEVFTIKNLNAFIIHYFTGGIKGLQKKSNRNWLKHYENFKTLSKHFLQRGADLNIKLWLENDSNVKVDRASMAYSVEVRSPFLDYRIIELARTMPIGFRYKRKIRKHILRDILKEYIPEEVFDQPKKGFGVPLDHWIRLELRQEFLEKLDDDFLYMVPNLDILKFKKQLGQHMNNKGDFKGNIWKLYVLRKWYEEFGFYPKQSKMQQSKHFNKKAVS